MAEELPVSFIIPCYRSQESLPATLQSIQRQAGRVEFETLVVYSGWEEPGPPPIHSGERALVFPERLLPGAARNRGAARARGRLLAFVDADAVLLAGWLERMLEEQDRHPSTLIGGAVANRNPGTAPSRVLHLIEFSEFLPGLSGGEREAISTSNCLLPAALLARLGGFPEEMAMSEDWEFCHRLPEPPRFVPETGIQHLHRSDWPSVRLHLRGLGYWSGRLRRSRPELPGGWLRHFPPACLALIGLRLYRIRQRRKQARLGPAYPPESDWGGLLAGLWHWTRGFQRGLQGLEPWP